MVTLSQKHVLHSSVLVTLLFLPCCLLADVLVVTGANSPSITLSREQVRDVFLGKVVALPNGSSATLFDQPESSPLRDEFYMKLTNKSAAQAKAYWAQLHFTGRGVPPRAGTGSDDVKRMLNATPGAIGYIEKSSLDRSVKVVLVVQ